jgi:hypothetical protein
MAVEHLHRRWSFVPTLGSSPADSLSITPNCRLTSRTMTVELLAANSRAEGGSPLRYPTLDPVDKSFLSQGGKTGTFYCSRCGFRRSRTVRHHTSPAEASGIPP